MGKPSGDEQEAHRRPTEWEELAPSFAKATAAEQHSEVPSFSSGGKWVAWAAEVFVLTWGGLVGRRSH